MISIDFLILFLLLPEIIPLRAYNPVYENTSAATEATMCGCPVVFIPNEFMKEPPLALKETGKYGIAWGLDEKEINYAKETVHLAFDNYLKSLDSYEGQLENFINLTQEKANNLKSGHKILSIPFGVNRDSCLVCHSLNVLKICLIYYRSKGFIKVILKIYQKIKNKLF